MNEKIFLDWLKLLDEKEKAHAIAVADALKKKEPLPKIPETFGRVRWRNFVFHIACMLDVVDIIYLIGIIKESEKHKGR